METARGLEEKRGLVRLKNLPTKVTFSSISKEPFIDGKPIVPHGGEESSLVVVNRFSPGPVRKAAANHARTLTKAAALRM